MRKYKSNTVKKLIESSSPREHDPEAIILEKVQDLHEMYFMLHEEKDYFPIDMEKLASVAGVKVKKSLMPYGTSGQLIPKDNNMIALINAIDHPNRQNFTIGHEIGHTFFPEFKKRKFRAEFVNNVWGDNISINDEEEYLCDFAASELLLPTKYFLEKLKQFTFSIDSLPKLSDYFGASYEAIAIKMAKVADFPCAILVCEKSYKESERMELEKRKTQLTLFEPPPILEKLRVKFLTRSPFWKSKYIPKEASVPEDSSIYEAAAKLDVVKTEKEGLIIGRFNGVFDLETYPVGSMIDENGLSKKTFTLMQTT